MTTAEQAGMGVGNAGMPVHFRDVPASTEAGVSTHLVHADLDGSGLEMSVLVLAEQAVTSREVVAGRDEVVYVVSGAGEAYIAGAAHRLGAGTAALVTGGTAYTLRASGHRPLEVVAISGRIAPDVTCGTGPPTIDLQDQGKFPAVSSREYQLLFDPDSGCSGMTQFVGYVPEIRTPRHIHPYDEMLCIVRGSGTVEINGQEQEVSAGWCYYLPRGTPHLVQNRNQEHLVELGVFTPAGSPTQNTPVE